MAIFHKHECPWWCVGTHFKCFIRDIQWAWQRAKRGYCYWDIWDVDVWFFKTIEKILIDFKKDITGYPSEMTKEEWNNVLDKMVMLAHKINNYEETYDDNFSNYMESDKTLNTDIAAFFALFSKYIRHLWW